MEGGTSAVMLNSHLFPRPDLVLSLLLRRKLLCHLDPLQLSLAEPCEILGARVRVVIDFFQGMASFPLLCRRR